MTYNFITNERDLAIQNAGAALRLLREGRDDEVNYVNSSNERLTTEEVSLRYLHISNNIQTYEKNMFHFYSSSVFMFQAMMEAVINHTINDLATGKYNYDIVKFTKNTKDNRVVVVDSWVLLSKCSFGEKWVHTLLSLNQTTDGFGQYKNSVYVLRNSLIHPGTNNLRRISDLNNNYLLDGYQHGWNALCSLNNGLGLQADDTWEIRVNLYGLSMIER